jgi:hypothetical protein
LRNADSADDQQKDGRDAEGRVARQDGDKDLDKRRGGETEADNDEAGAGDQPDRAPKRALAAISNCAQNVNHFRVLSAIALPIA